MYKWWAKNWWGVAIVIIVHEIVNLDNRKTFQIAKTLNIEYMYNFTYDVLKCTVS